MAELTLEAEEWYALTNWLRERENRLQYALRSKSAEWEFVHDLRRRIERQQDETAETAGATRTVTLTDRQVAYLLSFLRRRARKLLFLPWRDRERRDVRHLRDHLLAETERGEAGREGAEPGVTE
ncbi:hypothetical protein [Halorussus salinisoli]|uniref:hypothetical protein n=1 Tax=Halorussus salinisoli TaxID=2558242 RepID=UPI0010C17DC6|nr:hypothetical protein [Halorussus salinisoli]